MKYCFWGGLYTIHVRKMSEYYFTSRKVQNSNTIPEWDVLSTRYLYGHMHILFVKILKFRHVKCMETTKLHIFSNRRLNHAPLVQRLGYEPSKLETRVRLPDGAHIFCLNFPFRFACVWIFVRNPFQRFVQFL